MTQNPTPTDLTGDAVPADAPDTPVDKTGPEIASTQASTHVTADTDADNVPSLTGGDSLRGRLAEALRDNLMRRTFHVPGAVGGGFGLSEFDIADVALTIIQPELEWWRKARRDDLDQIIRLSDECGQLRERLASEWTTPVDDPADAHLAASEQQGDHARIAAALRDILTRFNPLHDHKGVVFGWQSRLVDAREYADWTAIIGADAPPATVSSTVIPEPTPVNAPPRRPTSCDVPCDTCFAPAFEYCRSVGGLPARVPHLARQRAWVEKHADDNRQIPDVPGICGDIAHPTDAADTRTYTCTRPPRHTEQGVRFHDDGNGVSWRDNTPKEHHA